MPYKPFLIIQSRAEDEAANDEFQSFLKYMKLTLNDVVRIRIEQRTLGQIDLSKYSGMVVGGSPFDISTSEKEKSATQKRVEKEMLKLLDKVIDQDFPYLGACSGNGLLCHWFSVPVTKKYGEPVSGIDISLTPAGQKDLLLRGLPTQFRALVGHKEACDFVPKQATLLATGQNCPVQMFKVKNNIYATQFHPEATKETFVLRINVYKNYGYFPPADAQKLIQAIKQEEITQPNKILTNFAKRYRST